MTAKFDLSSVWRNVKELDLQHLREEAEKDIRLLIVGADHARMQLLANQLRTDPRRPQAETHTPIPTVHLQASADITSADLVLLIASDADENQETQSRALSQWAVRGLGVIIIYDRDAHPQGAVIPPLQSATFASVMTSISDWDNLAEQLVPRMIQQLPGSSLALGRRFPLMRETIANNLISETSTANAAYAFSTGLAEIVPILDIPLNVADIIILTKAQAMLVYKLGLALGMSSDWQYYITELGGVIGSSFLWRQVARSLVGLIPAWGIIPKVAVAYSGTYAVGQAVLHWYLTGRHVTKKMLRGFSQEAMARGKTIGKNFTKRLGRSKKKIDPQLPEGEIITAVSPTADARICPNCSTINDADANFCKNCAHAF